MQIKDNRNELIDILKAIAIILVVVGHTMQYGTTADYLQNKLFYDNAFFQFIYTFHMPLFMLISGYLFYASAARHSFSYIVKSKVKTLLFPVLIWSFIPFFYNLIKNGDFSVMTIFKTYGTTAINNFWFLWSLLFWSLVFVFVKRFLKDNIFVYIGIFILTFFIPDTLAALHKFIYPFFMLGYFFNKNKAKFTHFLSSEKSKLICLILSGATFFVMFLFYNRNSFAYTTGYYLFKNRPNIGVLNQLGINLFRTAIGFVSSVFVILLVSFIYKHTPKFINKALCFIGQNSLGIYIISDVLSLYLLAKILFIFPDISYFRVFLETIIIFFLSLFLSILIKKIKPLNRILFGGR
ncbi:MAG: acyltransferase family protein [Clostridia bacterium]